MLLGGRKITAVEAYERGLVTRVIPKSEFQSTVKEITTRMASLPPKVHVCTCIMLYIVVYYAHSTYSAL